MPRESWFGLVPSVPLILKFQFEITVMKIALGVTGGVAAYKAAELVRRLQQEKLDVQVVMTRSAQEFVTPLTFAALTGKKVITGMFGADDAAPANVESAIEHIAVAQRIDLLLVAPATADILGEVRARNRRRFSVHALSRDESSRGGRAGDERQHVGASRRRRKIWRRFALRGVHVVDPDEGYLACGMTGAGRLAATETIALQSLRRSWPAHATLRSRRF